MKERIDLKFIHVVYRILLSGLERRFKKAVRKLDWDGFGRSWKKMGLRGPLMGLAGPPKVSG